MENTKLIPFGIYQVEEEFSNETVEQLFKSTHALNKSQRHTHINMEFVTSDDEFTVGVIGSKPTIKYLTECEDEIVEMIHEHCFDDLVHHLYFDMGSKEIYVKDIYGNVLSLEEFIIHKEVSDDLAETMIELDENLPPFNEILDVVFGDMKISMNGKEIKPFNGCEECTEIEECFPGYTVQEQRKEVTKEIGGLVEEFYSMLDKL